MDAVAAGRLIATGTFRNSKIPPSMTPFSPRRRANRQSFARTPDLYQPRPQKRFADGGFGPWLLAALVVALLFAIVLVTH